MTLEERIDELGNLVKGLSTEMLRMMELIGKHQKTIFEQQEEINKLKQKVGSVVIECDIMD